MSYLPGNSEVLPEGGYVAKYLALSLSRLFVIYIQLSH